MAIQNITVPDVGGAKDVEVIEILVKVGDFVTVDQSLITLESDKASMDVPAPFAGTIKEIKINVGDKINEGDLILVIESETVEVGLVHAHSDERAATKVSPTDILSVTVPDVGGAKNVEVIEVHVKVGDTIKVDDPLITLESDKASMDVPSPYAGIVKEVKVKIGDKINEGDSILVMEAELVGAGLVPARVEDSARATTRVAPTSDVSSSSVSTQATARDHEIQRANNSATVYAGPAVRRIAQEFGVNLTLVKGSGRKGRIVKEDVQAYVKRSLEQVEKGGATGSIGAGLNLLPWPNVDFKKFGQVEVKELNKIKRATARNLHRNWVMIPHVTQFDEVDITEMEAFRQQHKDQAAKDGYKLTPIVFIMKAVVAALKEFPTFNASLDESGENLIIKKYYNIGIAVDTPNGLVVPVIKNVDSKSLGDLAKELAVISVQARDGQLKMADMQGGNFAISSLGGIGGTAFTPIVNAPDVAILGVSKSQHKPVYIDGKFEPRLMLPLSLSYDHRVIDGAEGARFITFLSKQLSNMENIEL